MAFQKATKKRAKLRLALIGPAGSGKTYTALSIARNFGRVALIDTEHGSASLYSDVFDFDVLELDSFNPQNYISAIADAVRARYDVLIIDSLSHAWTGKDGVLELKDRFGGDSFTNGWRKASPLHNQLVEAILAADIHIIATMRAKTDYVMEEYEENGRKKVKPVKVGLAPVQREGMDYEFTVTADVDRAHNVTVDKTRCPALSGRVFPRAGKDIADILLTWLDQGEPVPEPQQQPAQQNGNGKHEADELAAARQEYAAKWNELKRRASILGETPQQPPKMDNPTPEAVRAVIDEMQARIDDVNRRIAEKQQSEAQPA